MHDAMRLYKISKKKTNNLYTNSPLSLLLFFSDKVMGEQHISATVPRDRTDEQVLINVSQF